MSQLRSSNSAWSGCSSGQTHSLPCGQGLHRTPWMGEHYPICSVCILKLRSRAQEGLFEEAGLLREREVDMKVRLGGLPHEAPQVPCVTLADVESVLSAWTGIPPERMGQDDRDRLSLMEPALKASCFLRICDIHSKISDFSEAEVIALFESVNRI